MLTVIVVLVVVYFVIALLKAYLCNAFSMFGFNWLSWPDRQGFVEDGLTWPRSLYEMFLMVCYWVRYDLTHRRATPAKKY
jgi:hypothetical protein